ncbi:MAG: EAL domain-containing protein [Rhodocyclaceae bacterium]
MRDKRFYDFLHRQIPVLMVLALFPGLGYLFLGWLNNVFVPAFAWYLLVIAVTLWGYRLYRTFDFAAMGESRRDRWYRQCSWFVHAFFLLWPLIFLLYIGQDAYKLHYIAIFTEIGASVVASALLASDRRLYRPTILDMAKVLKLNIVAEGVETAAQFDFLFRHGYQLFQGYYHAKPLTNEQFISYYRQRE